MYVFMTMHVWSIFRGDKVCPRPEGLSTFHLTIGYHQLISGFRIGHNNLLPSILPDPSPEVPSNLVEPTTSACHADPFASSSTMWTIDNSNRPTILRGCTEQLHGLMIRLSICAGKFCKMQRSIWLHLRRTMQPCGHSKHARMCAAYINLKLIDESTVWMFNVV